MLQVVYLPNQDIMVDEFIVISSLEELLDFIKFNKIKLLSIPATEDAFDVFDCMINNNISIKTIHLQQSNDLISRLKIFFTMAKTYSEEGIKNNIILKHEYLDGIIEKNKKKD